MVYIIHPADQNGNVTWVKSYIKAFDDPDEPTEITLWQAFDNMTFDRETDRVYLFGSYNVNGYLGAYEASDEALQSELENATKVVTVKHPVYFKTELTEIPSA